MDKDQSELLFVNSVMDAAHRLSDECQDAITSKFKVYCERPYTFEERLKLMQEIEDVMVFHAQMVTVTINTLKAQREAAQRYYSIDEEEAIIPPQSPH